MCKIYQKNTICSENPAKGKLGGFTLIELLVVVLIIGILAAIALPQYEKAVEKTRAVEAVTMLRALQNSLNVYIMTNGETITSLDDLDIKVPENSYYRYENGGCGIIAHHPQKNLGFEFCQQFTGWGGAQFCIAPQADEKLNNICKSLGSSVIDHNNGSNNYYKLN